MQRLKDCMHQYAAGKELIGDLHNVLLFMQDTFDATAMLQQVLGKVEVIQITAVSEEI